jgi:hypothetical protein
LLVDYTNPKNAKILEAFRNVALFYKNETSFHLALIDSRYNDLDLDYQTDVTVIKAFLQNDKTNPLTFKGPFDYLSVKSFVKKNI